MQVGARLRLPATASHLMVVSQPRVGHRKLAPVLLILILALVSFARSADCSFDWDLNELPQPEDDDDDDVNWPATTSEAPTPQAQSLPLTPLAAEPANQEVQQVEVRDSNKEEKAGHGSSSSNKWGFMGRLAERASDAVKHSLSKLPKYFDFDAFQQQYRRRYSASEAIYRRAAFLKRCYQVFKARVKHRLNQLSYQQSVNKFADRSPNEIKKMFMSAPPIEFRAEGQSEHEYYRELERVARERDQNDLELDSRAAAISGEDVDGDGEPDEMIFSERQAKQIIERMQDEAAGDYELRMAIRDELRGASDVEFSQAAGGGGDNDGSKPLPWPGKQRSAPGAVFDLHAPVAAPIRDYKPPELGDDERIDWSEHMCFHTVYDQGESCGKCYVMASTALAEFYKCSELEDVVEQRKFSKKYVLDCAQKFAPTILGCKGGSLLDTLRFISLGGLHNIEGWTETRSLLLKGPAKGAKGLDKKCPLDKFRTPVSEWGAIKIEMNPVRVSTNEWKNALDDGPLVASVQMPSVGLETYAGGVHDGEGCATSGNWHAMVLVGYGRSPSTGVAYWRFRNSWGADWGDAGHFNLAMSVPSACLAGGVRVYREPIVAALAA